MGAGVRFGTAGIRGRFGREVGVPEAAAVGSAVARVAGEPILMASDWRLSGPALAAAAASGAMASGVDVEWAGRVPLPALSRACRREGRVGLYVTASHNPPEYNGFKVIWRDGGEVWRELEEEIEGLAARRVVHSPEPGGWKEVRGIEELYARELLEKFGAALSGVYALDPGNGTVCGLVDELFTEMGASPVVINGHPDGRFPGRPSEPTPENLEVLSSLVRRVGVKVGFAWDGDGDRLAVVGPDGRFVPHYKVSALVARSVRARRVITSVDMGRGLREVVEGAGGKVVEWRIGDLPSELRRRGSSGWIADLVTEPWKVMLPDWGPFFDGVAAAVVVAREVEEAGGLQAATEGIPEYHQVRTSVPRRGGPAAERAAAKLISALGERVLGVDRVDGVRVWVGGGWVLLRDSGTEPKVRIYSESADREEAVELAEMGRRAVLSVSGGSES